MVMTAPQMPQGERILAPAGTIQAVCYDVWDLGWQKTEWQGKEKLLPKIIIAFELKELIADGKRAGERYGISRRYTFSFHEKANLGKDLEAWLNVKITKEERKGFDVETLIGKNCFLSIIHTEKDGKTYSNISSVMPIMKGMEEMTPMNPRGIPEWVQKVQAKALDEQDVSLWLEQQAQLKAEANEPELEKKVVTDEEIPF